MIMTETANTGNSGVNREEAKSILHKFLDNKNYRVLAVKGKWGVGKTHLVQTFLEEHYKNYYLYASVFGISSIEQLKARLIANYKNNLQSDNKSSQIKTELVVNSANKSIANTFEWFKRILPRLEKVPKIDLSLSEKFSIPIAGSLISIAGDLALEILFNLNVRENSIICIDDLERKSKLPIEDILGFIEYLVQDRKCKIVLIYNGDNLDESDKKALQDYREKVIDREFKLDPKVDENLNFIFRDHPDIDVIKEVFQRTGTNNIRVIKKTGWLIDELLPLMENWEDSLRHQIIRNCIIINLAKLDTELCKKFPKIPEMISTLLIDQSEYMGTDQKSNDIARFDLAMEKIKVKGIAQYLGYQPLETIDKIVIQFIETSLLNDIEFIKQGDFIDEREKRKQILKKLHELSYNLYYESFADNEQDIINGIINFLEDNHLNLSISQFERIELFTSILEFDISKYEKPLLEKILTEILEPNSYHDLRTFKNKLTKYPDLQASFEHKTKEYYQTLDITTAVKNIMNADTSSISTELQRDIEFLKSCTVNEYCKWLEKGDPDLIKMVEFLQDCGYQPASENLRQAIRILAECSNINKIRAKYLYKIDIDIPN
ncbi:MAG: hypothetical protein EAZ87_16510 [Nostocales cyanobacterium]|nr:MAG: hypothetical protein EAZ87_16510 [Nostocales cyanobacterium]